MTLETRSFAAAELRTKGRRLEGYAAVFNTRAEIHGGMTEVIVPGAFRNTLAHSPDILALVDHDLTRVVGRTRSGTLRLSEDRTGLAFDLDVPDTQAGRDILALGQRGDLGGMSFGFRAIDQNIDGDLRELRAVELIEISVVSAFPAYAGTVVNTRAKAGTGLLHDHAARTLRILELLK